MAAHLPGMCAKSSRCRLSEFLCTPTSLGKRFPLFYRTDAVRNPVATVAINGGANAGLLAAKILATSDEELLAKLKAYSQELKEQVEAKDARLQEVGYKNY